MVKETTDEPIPEWASHLEIADRTLSDHVERWVNLAAQQPKAETAPRLIDEM